MITREEYNKALDVVELYHKQLALDVDTVIREKIEDWLVKNRRVIPNRLFLAISRESERYTYMDEINRERFLRIRWNGVTLWREYQHVTKAS